LYKEPGRSFDERTADDLLRLLDGGGEMIHASCSTDPKSLPVPPQSLQIPVSRTQPSISGDSRTVPYLNLGDLVRATCY